MSFQKHDPESKSETLFLTHLELYIDIVPGSVGVWANLMRFLDEGMCVGGEQSGQRYRESYYKAETTLGSRTYAN
jgi:hypothetical protein